VVLQKNSWDDADLIKVTIEPIKDKDSSLIITILRICQM